MRWILVAMVLVVGFTCSSAEAQWRSRSVYDYGYQPYGFENYGGGWNSGYGSSYLPRDNWSIGLPRSHMSGGWNATVWDDGGFGTIEERPRMGGGLRLRIYDW